MRIRRRRRRRRGGGRKKKRRRRGRRRSRRRDVGLNGEPRIRCLHFPPFSAPLFLCCTIAECVPKLGTASVEISTSVE